MTDTDSLGRSTFHHITPQEGVRPTNREIRWLKHIKRHGPQSSQYLYELTRDTHRCKDTALRQMQKLRTGGFLRLPPQQRATEHADFNPYIYDLTNKATEHLFDLEQAEPTVRPTGHWRHGFMTSCVTSSIDIAATRQGVHYIPAHTILGKNGASFEIPLGRSKLIPDQLFALDYGGSFRAFALEVDRGTEPGRSASARKSLAQSIEQYATLIERDLHKAHYGLKANLIVLWVFGSRTRQARFLEMLEGCPQRVRQSITTQTIDFRQTTNQLRSSTYNEPWQRAFTSSFRMSAR